jgi:colanic acid/amylovoran biosynthesis glycosyltransferase
MEKSPPCVERSPPLKTLGYLCSEYPALSHTFISREIHLLEQEGFTIASATINPSKNVDKMGEWDQARARSTFCVKTTPKGRVLATLARYFLGLPRFFGTLGFAYKTAWLAGPKDLLKATGYFIQAVLLHDWARKAGVEHLHVHFANPAATVALIATRFGRLEFSLSVHGPDEFYDVEKNSIREKIEAAVFVRCIGYFCQSQLMRLSPVDQWSKFHIVRCGLHRGEFVPRPPRTGPAQTILCVGRLCPSKGQAILVQAAAALKARGRDFQLLLLGGGEDLELIRGIVARDGLTDRVTVAGPVGHSRVKLELARTDLFVLPSFAEGIPVALMEAMAAGVPVVSTNITGIPELIEHGVDGFLTPASHVDQLTDVLDQFLLGQVDTADLVTKAAAKVEALYDVDTNTKALGALFTQFGRLI